jgi:hypothetical protein
MRVDVGGRHESRLKSARSRASQLGEADSGPGGGGDGSGSRRASGGTNYVNPLNACDSVREEGAIRYSRRCVGTRAVTTSGASVCRCRGGIGAERPDQQDRREKRREDPPHRPYSARSCLIRTMASSTACSGVMPSVTTRRIAFPQLVLAHWIDGRL